MAGFFDLLAMLLRWKSARAIANPPYRAVAGQVWNTGTEAGTSRVDGAAAGSVVTNSE